MSSSTHSFGDEQESLINWPADQQLPTFTEPEHLDVADIIDASSDIQLMFATLQGIVNRAQPRIYLIETEEEGKYTWLNDLNIPYEEHDDYMEILKKYQNEITGMIVYDPDVIDSVNIATTMAGIEDAIVVSPDLADQLQAAPYQLEVIEDLQGKFTDKIDAYTWQYENLWDQTTDRMVVGLNPGTSIGVPSDLPDSFDIIAKDTTQETGANNRDIYDIDLSDYVGEDEIYLRFDDAFPQDGWGPAVHEITMDADGEEIAQFIAGTPEEKTYLYDRQHSQVSSTQGGHRFADNDHYFVYRFTPPEDTEELVVSVEMWNQYQVSVSKERPISSEEREPYGYLRDYAVANQAMVVWLAPNAPEEREIFDGILADVEPGTPYLGWFADDVEGEFGGVEYLSRHGVYVVPADWFNNLTVFSGTEIKPVEAKKRQFRPLEDKIYVTLMFGEGDNFQYNQHHMRNLWNDPARGEVPINWTSSPLLYDAAPAILNYYQKTATKNDLLVTGPSGVGYFYADPWPADHFPTFLEETYPYIEKTGMTVPYVLNRVAGENISLSVEKAQAYEDKYNASGLLLSWEANMGVTIKNDTLPVSTIRGVGSIQEGKQVLAEAKDNWDGKSPAFVSLGILARNLSPSDVVTMTESLGPAYEIVLADEYFSHIREAYRLAEPSVTLLQNQLDAYLYVDEITGPLVNILSNRLRQTKHHYSNNRLPQAIHQLQKFQEHMEKKGEYITENAKFRLKTHSDLLLENWLQ